MDVKRMSLSAQVQTNYMPRVLGSMMLRPGLAYIGSTYNNGRAKYIPFVKQTTDTALIEVNGDASILRVLVNDALVTLPSVTTTITNPDFLNAGGGWTDNDEAGCTSLMLGIGAGCEFIGNGNNAAIRDQTVTVSGANIGVEHAILISVGRGPITIRVGTSTADDSYVNQTTLDDGEHWLSFTPTGNFNIRFMSTLNYNVLVVSCNIATGILNLPVPWNSNDLGNLRWDQSADVIFVACDGYQQRRIERRGTHSYSLVLFKCPDGPFLIENITPTTIGTNGLTGEVTLTASRPTFKVPTGFLDGQRGHVGAMWQIVSNGQITKLAISSANTFTDPIKLTGALAVRDFALIITGLTGTSNTVTLQYSVGVPGIWTDCLTINMIYPTNPRTQYGVTDPAVITTDFPPSAQTGMLLNDGFDNQIVYYRAGIKTGNYSSGTTTVALSCTTGSITGTARIYQVNSSTVALAQVIENLGGTSAITTWSEGAWSDVQGYPQSVVLYEGRLWWGGKNGIFGSVSDAYTSYDPTVIGDSAPLNRTIGSGPVDIVNWLLPLQRLILGAQGAEFSVRSTALDDALTPTNFNIKTISGQGSGFLPAVKIDQRGLFVNRTGCRVYDLAFSFQFYDYATSDASAIVPDLLKPGVVRIGLQRQPDTRVHFVRSDGVVIVQVQDPNEEVSAFITVQTNGIVEDVVTLPNVSGNLDDQVYYLVNRTINGATVRYLEKWAQEAECRGDQALCKIADSHIVYSGGATQTITGLSTLEGQQVVVWADGADVGTNDTVVPWTQRYTVSGGKITLAVAASNVVVGLPYTAQFQSTKLGLATQNVQSPLNQQKRIGHLGLLLADTHPRGLQFGPTFAILDDMPLIEEGTLVGTATETAYDENVIEFPGTWTTDARLCLQSVAPRPCTVLAATIDLQMHS